MSTPAVVAVLKSSTDWNGTFVWYDGYLEGVGAALIRAVIASGGKVDSVVNRALAANQGWRTLFEEPQQRDNAFMPRGVTPRNLARADPAFVYLFDRAGRRLHVLCPTNQQTSHGFDGLGGFGYVCSVALEAGIDPAVLQKSVEPSLLWESTFAPTGWSSGAFERKELADRLGREAQRRGMALAAFRNECKALFAAFVREQLKPDEGPIVVRFVCVSLGIEVEFEGLKFWMSGHESPAGTVELLQQSGKSFSLDQTAVLAELDAAKPGLAAAARVILTCRSGWLFELLAWFRQEVVPDPLANHIPPIELRHPDGRVRIVEAMESRLTITQIDADGDRVDRNRDFSTFEEAKQERDQVLEQIISGGFAPLQ